MARLWRFKGSVFPALLGLVTGAFAPLGAEQLLGDGKSLLTRVGDRYVLASGGVEVAIVPPAGTEIEGVVSLDRNVLVTGHTQVRPAEGSGETELFLALSDSGSVAT